MKDCSDKFLVIGAGPCGLGVAKALKEAEIPYEQAAYCSSKSAVRGFTESLRHELEGTKITGTA